MKFPVSFTLGFLCLSWVTALDFPVSFLPPPDIDIDAVSRPYNRTLLSGTVSISDQIGTVL